MNQNKRALIFILNLVVSLVVAYFVYDFVYVKAKKECNDRKAVYERFNNISTQIDDFGSIQIKMDELKDSLSEMFAIYKDTFYSNEQNVNAYKVRILDLLKETEISVKEDDVVQENKDNTVEITLKLKTTYQKICKFLFELERYSKVLSFTMDYENKIEMKITPILFSTEVNDSFSGRNTIDFIDDDVRKAGYFKEISDKIFGKVKEVGYIQTWRDFEPIPETPFYFYVQEKKVRSTAPVAVTKPTIVIDGIMYEKQKPMVIIEGKFYYVGDVYNGSKIVQINVNNIKVNTSGTIFTIKMEN
ncbi:MAG: hypothetical protein IKN62_00555 [Elusimicrobia bacterium]|nr:hypothetical protein [Elusimicrobiota bacterium]